MGNCMSNEGKKKKDPKNIKKAPSNKPRSKS